MLTQEDKEKVNKLSELLKELNTISQDVQELLFAPKIEEQEPNPNVVKYYEKRFTTAQQEPKECEDSYMPKYGEWFKNDNGALFSRTGKIGIIEGDTQDGTVIEFYTHTWLYKPTPEEIQAHLTKIAEKKGFKEGVKINQPWVKLETNNYPVGSEPPRLISNDIFWVGNLCVWYKGQWAEIINESKGENYKVLIGDNEHGYEVLVLGINTIGKAEQIKFSIQELLKTL